MAKKIAGILLISWPIALGIASLGPKVIILVLGALALALIMVASVSWGVSLLGD